LLLCISNDHFYTEYFCFKWWDLNVFFNLHNRCLPILLDKVLMILLSIHSIWLFSKSYVKIFYQNYFHSDQDFSKNMNNEFVKKNSYCPWKAAIEVLVAIPISINIHILAIVEYSYDLMMDTSITHNREN
jgi:hypothetical protein